MLHVQRHLDGQRRHPHGARDPRRRPQREPLREIPHLGVPIRGEVVHLRRQRGEVHLAPCGARFRHHRGVVLGDALVLAGVAATGARGQWCQRDVDGIPRCALDPGRGIRRLHSVRLGVEHGRRQRVTHRDEPPIRLRAVAGIRDDHRETSMPLVGLGRIREPDDRVRRLGRIDVVMPFRTTKRSDRLRTWGSLARKRDRDRRDERRGASLRNQRFQQLGAQPAGDDAGPGGGAQSDTRRQV